MPDSSVTSVAINAATSVIALLLNKISEYVAADESNVPLFASVIALISVAIVAETFEITFETRASVSIASVEDEDESSSIIVTVT